MQQRKRRMQKYALRFRYARPSHQQLPDAYGTGYRFTVGNSKNKMSLDALLQSVADDIRPDEDYSNEFIVAAKEEVDRALPPKSRMEILKQSAVEVQREEIIETKKV